jgi:hypothetical protein
MGRRVSPGQRRRRAQGRAGLPLIARAAEGGEAEEQATADEQLRRACKTVPVEVSVGCVGLPSLEMTASCPSVFAVLWLYSPSDRRWQEHGRTEVCRHGDDPQFARSFFLSYRKSHDPVSYHVTDQWLRFQLYLRSSTLPHLSNHTMLGQVQFPLRELYRKPIKRLTLPLLIEVDETPGAVSASSSVSSTLPGSPSKDSSTLVLRLALVGDTSGYVECETKVMKLGQAGAKRGADTFLTVSRYCGGQFEVVHRTPHHQNSLAPRFGLFEASMHRLCLNDPELYLQFAVWNVERDGRHTLLGSVETCLVSGAAVLAAVVSSQAGV